MSIVRLSVVLLLLSHASTFVLCSMAAHTTCIYYAQMHTDAHRCTCTACRTPSLHIASRVSTLLCCSSMPATAKIEIELHHVATFIIITRSLDHHHHSNLLSKIYQFHAPRDNNPSIFDQRFTKGGTLTIFHIQYPETPEKHDKREFAIVLHVDGSARAHTENEMATIEKNFG